MHQPVLTVFSLTEKGSSEEKFSVAARGPGEDCQAQDQSIPSRAPENSDCLAFSRFRKQAQGKRGGDHEIDLFARVVDTKHQKLGLISLENTSCLPNKTPITLYKQCPQTVISCNKKSQTYSVSFKHSFWTWFIHYEYI